MKKNSIKSGINVNQIDLDDFYNEIESNLEFLIGVTYTCVIKENVVKTLKDFQEAKMKIFMISGDSEDKTMAVAFKTKLIERGYTLKRLVANDNKKLFIMMKYIFNTFRKEMDDNQRGRDNLRKDSNKKSIFEFKQKNIFTLISDGKTLEIIFQNKYLANHFKFLLLLCKNFIGYNMTQYANKELVMMVKKLFCENTNETILAIGSTYGDLVMMQEADISMEIQQKNKNKAFFSDISLSDFKYTSSIVFIWSKVGLENVQTNLYNLAFVACFLTYFRFICSFLSYFSESEIVPTVFYVLIFKNFIILSILEQILIKTQTKIALLKRFPILHKQTNWKKNYEMKVVALEILIPSALLAFFVFVLIYFHGQEINFPQSKTMSEFQSETYIIFTIVLYAKVTLIHFI